MEGAPPPRGGCVLTGAKLKGTSELVRFLYDAVKPNYVYDRYNDMYLCTPS